MGSPSFPFPRLNSIYFPLPIMSKVISAYSATPYRTILPTLPDHCIWEPMGLPLDLRSKLWAALQTPTGISPGGIGTLAKVDIAPTVREVDCLSIDFPIYSAVCNAFTATVSALTQKYLGLAATPCSTYGIFRYNSPTGHYVEHCDAGRIIGDTLQLDYPCRNISFVYYVNDDFTGGDFELIPEDAGGSIRFRPVADNFILFPSDPRYPHKVHPTLSGTRYSIVNWFSLQGLTDSNANEFVGVPRPTR